ncbi:probable tRNA (uracil-O(2)-)-methyltransferase isoform X2 [Dysidea avara]|uniref:probable tRNA (uracil-O(2)-)-methyltransferase isoform X2 n=1 Tax=Dysidea avara TaxID=196820 RepID=UPI0033269E7D
MEGLQFKLHHDVKCDNVDYEGFNNATDTWIHRPQVVNRKLAGAVVVKQFTMPRARLNEAISLALINSEEESVTKTESVSCLVRKLLPRTKHVPAATELVVKDDETFRVLFLPVEHSDNLFPYCLQFLPLTSEVILKWCNCIKQPCCHGDGKLTDVLCSVPESDNSVPIPEASGGGINIVTLPWLVHVLVPKVVTWAQSKDEGMAKKDSLVPLEHYMQVYQMLKKKYAAPLIEMWPEVTDPLKYVYEDIAIASYLIVLWELERKEMRLDEKKQSFIDLGCGNGLLVYLLTMEGYPGVGIDVRKRKIWDMYGQGVLLKEETLVPSEATQYPHYDWLIGNHCDELTPWIPLIAARSSYNTRYFSIPCCFHDFDGKYCRSDPSQSQYASYLQYTREIGEQMGFIIQQDHLRIPSSKKVCQIGMKRSYSPAEEAVVDKKRKEFLQEHCRPTEKNCSHSNEQEVVEAKQWAAQFNPRASVEPVKNCTQIKKDVQEYIVQKLTSTLLETVNMVPSELGPWNVGGRIALKEAAMLIDPPLLSQLKQEHGGLQTLFRNHHQIFVAREGYVQLRDWSKKKDGGKSVSRKRNKPSLQNLHHKTTLCWFHTHHPQGCPRLECCYAHGLEDLATRPQFSHAKPKK